MEMLTFIFEPIQDFLQKLHASGVSEFPIKTVKPVTNSFIIIHF